MADLHDPVMLVPLLLLLVEFATTLVLSRRRVKHRRRIVLGAYVGFVICVFAFALIRPDEFGFGFIPLLVLTEPWSLLLRSHPVSSHITGYVDSIYGIAFGLLFNALLVLLIDHVSRPKSAGRNT